MQLAIGFDNRNTVNGNGGAQGGTVERQQRITAKGLLQLLESQGYRCALSGRELTPQTAALDHKNPLSRNGENTISNVQVVHSQVNIAKATMTTEEFVAVCREVIAWHDRG